MWRDLEREACLPSGPEEHRSSALERLRCLPPHCFAIQKPDSRATQHKQTTCLHTITSSLRVSPVADISQRFSRLELVALWEVPALMGLPQPKLVSWVEYECLHTVFRPAPERALLSLPHYLCRFCACGYFYSSFQYPPSFASCPGTLLYDPTPPSLT